MIYRLFFATVQFAIFASVLISQNSNASGTASAAMATTDIKPGTVLSHGLKPGVTMTFRYVPTVDGEASIWARSETLDVTLEVQDQNGKRLKFDDDSGG